DLAAGATLTLPDPGGRYLSAMVVNEDHFVEAIFHDAGDHELKAEDLGSRYVVVAMRILVDPADPNDIAAVAALQDRITLSSRSAEPFRCPEYDTTSLDETRDALLALARNLSGFDHMFGAHDEVDPVRHLI